MEILICAKLTNVGMEYCILVYSRHISELVITIAVLKHGTQRVMRRADNLGRLLRGDAVSVGC